MGQVLSKKMKDGARIRYLRLQHLDEFAKNTKRPISVLLDDLAALAGKMEDAVVDLDAGSYASQDSAQAIKDARRASVSKNPSKQKKKTLAAEPRQQQPEASDRRPSERKP